jgi:hypothetical protein
MKGNSSKPSLVAALESNKRKASSKPAAAGAAMKKSSRPAAASHSDELAPTPLLAHIFSQLQAEGVVLLRPLSRHRGGAGKLWKDTCRT